MVYQYSYLIYEWNQYNCFPILFLAIQIGLKVSWVVVDYFTGIESHQIVVCGRQMWFTGRR